MSGFGKKNYYKKSNTFQQKDEHRINWHIKTPSVRVIMEDRQFGVMNTNAALKLAQDNGLDLVEVAPEANPPVCRILDYGKFKFDQKIKKKESEKKQRESRIDLKELRLRPGIQDNDVDTKINHAKKFIEDGDKVQFTLQFRGQREMSHKDQGFVVMQKIISVMSEIASVEKMPKLEGNKIICILSPKVV